MDTTSYPTLTLDLDRKNIQRLATLLQRGFLVPVTGSISLLQLLLNFPGFDSNYIENRIETIFINGSAADSLTHFLVPGNTVALSAAMPGLAGAIFRKGGPHAGLRSTSAAAQKYQEKETGFLTIKLFNLIAADMAAPLLQEGILMKDKILGRFLQKQGEQLQTFITGAYLNDVSLPVDQPINLPKKSSVILIKIHTNSVNVHQHPIFVRSGLLT